MDVRDVALIITSLGTVVAIIAPIVKDYVFSQREQKRAAGIELKTMLCECLRTLDDEAEKQSLHYRDLHRAQEGKVDASKFENFSWSRRVESQALVIVALFEAEGITALDFQQTLDEYMDLSRRKLVPGENLSEDLSAARARLAACAAALFQQIKKKHGV
jgi:hypothetical protein